jgi:hypothetical protein
VAGGGTANGRELVRPARGDAQAVERVPVDPDFIASQLHPRITTSTAVCIGVGRSSDRLILARFSGVATITELVFRWQQRCRKRTVFTLEADRPELEHGISGAKVGAPRTAIRAVRLLPHSGWEHGKRILPQLAHQVGDGWAAVADGHDPTRPTTQIRTTQRDGHRPIHHLILPARTQTVTVARI